MELNSKIKKWEIIATASIQNRNKFWRAISLSVIKPHLINRRLAGAEQMCLFRSSNFDLNADGKLIYGIVDYIDSQSNDEVDLDFLGEALRQVDAQNDFEQISSQDLFKCDFSTEKRIFVILNKLLPKNLSSHKCTYEINILGKIKVKKMYYLELKKYIFIFQFR